ncbi:hypothetical protein P879_00219 [Paragonimus westermani]|uniref:G-protein coupled receptors family 1 profile domain-containing protein n=1 Tax=Paragonimus westermani TaxID=34504 RepID=A0A8T0DU54_9TREM|nr:hypothetical protein P879_00218 [Paragonimus westermani]KAF8571120.1 hypothetical protein P879_00219 [Paragonimus westermani]
MLYYSKLQWKLMNTSVSLLCIFGIVMNVIAFACMRYVRTQFMASRFLLHGHFVINVFGCVTLLAYLGTFNMNLHQTDYVDAVVCYLWMSYMPLWLVVSISLANLMCISFDRFWAVVYFRSYPHLSKSYILSLYLFQFVYTVLLVVPILLYSECSSDEAVWRDRVMEMHIILGFLLGFLIPGLLNCAFQVRVLLSIYRLTATETTTQTATNSTGHSDARLAIKFDANTMAITMVTVVMNVNYFVSRIYPQLQQLLVILQVLPQSPMHDWENPLIFPFGVSFCVEPFFIMLSSPTVRELLRVKCEHIVSVLHRYIIPCKS